jgi:hypothetical protein
MEKEITSISGKGKGFCEGRERTVTSYGGISVSVDFLNRIGHGEAVRLLLYASPSRASTASAGDDLKASRRVVS